MAQQDSILPEGIRCFNKHDNAPDFVMGKTVISLNKLVAFCKAHPEILSDYQGEKQLTLQMLWSKQGKLYANIDLYNTPYAAGTRGAPFATASSAPQGTASAPPKPPTAPAAAAAPQQQAPNDIPPTPPEDDLPF